MTTRHLDTSRHPIDDDEYRSACRSQIDATGALVLEGFFTPAAVAHVIAESAPHEPDAFYADSTHNVYLTAPDPTLPSDHPFNRQVGSSKGLIADDQVPTDSPLRRVYDDDSFRQFICAVLGINAVHPYDDTLSSINVHFASQGRELGWHFDNSSFAVTMLLQAPEAGGAFEYVPNARKSDVGDMGYERVAAALDGHEPVETLLFSPGDLVLFRGRDALHRVTPTRGTITRMLVVFAFNDAPGVRLSDSALRTFFGRTA